MRRRSGFFARADYCPLKTVLVCLPRAGDGGGFLLVSSSGVLLLTGHYPFSEVGHGDSWAADSAWTDGWSLVLALGLRHPHAYQTTNKVQAISMVAKNA